MELFHRNYKKGYSDVSHTSENKVFDIMDTFVFRSDVDLKMMYSEIFYAFDGYMLDKYRSGHIVSDEIEQEILVWIDFGKKIYTKGES